MLIRSGRINQTVEKGKDIAAVEQVDTHVEELSDGHRREVIIYSGVYVNGLPFGQPPLPEIHAPVSLEPGDVVRITADGYKVFDITRKGAVLWTNGELTKTDSARAAEVAERIEHRKEVRR